jgi:hypothetical protein
MKRIIAISGLFLMMLGIFSSCTNAGWSFPNFPYTTTYFPEQYPIRTLIFGDYIYDNSRDNNMQFLISATTGGVYKQTKNITVGFTVDPTLTNKLVTTSTSPTLPIVAMPANWYTLSNPSEIVIPSGRYDGGVTVTLTSDFTADTLAIVPHWVIPLRMTTTTADSILSGKSGMANPDPRISSNWALAPKNFTIFCVRYVNEWHGRYIVRGTDVVKKASDNSVIETITYHTQYLEGNTVAPMTTFRRNAVKYSNSVKRSTGSPGNFEMRLDFNASDITQATLSPTTRYPTRPVAGTAKMVLAKDIPSVDPQESWGNIPRNTIYLAYTITVGSEIHNCNDTLVFRDKNVAYADFVPVVTP